MTVKVGRCAVGGCLVLSVCLAAALVRAEMGRFHRFERLIPESGNTAVTGISSLFQDREGFLWLGTAAGLARYDGYGFAFHSPGSADGSLPDAVVIYPAFEDGAGEIWFGTHGDGLFRLDGSRRTFVQYRHDPQRADSLSGDIVLAVQEDGHGNIWVGTRLNGLCRYDRRKDSFSKFPLDPDAGGVWDLIVDRAGSVWVGTQDGGLFRVDPETGDTVNFRFILDNPRSLGGNTVWTLFEDSGGTVWAGTKGGGLNAYDPEGDRFLRFAGSADDPDDLARTTVTAIAEDGSGRLWIGTSSDGLRIWDRTSGSYVVARHDPQDPETLGDDHVSAILRDASGIMWIGTTRGGISKCLGDEVKLLHFKRNPHDPKSLSRNGVRALFEDSSGRLWIGLDEGLDRVDRKRGEVTRWDFGSEPGRGSGPGAVRSIRESRTGRIWLGTEQRGLISLDSGSGARTVYERDPAKAEGLANNRINVISVDRADPDVLWIGTQGGLNRFDSERGVWRRFSHDPSDPASIAGNIVGALAEDRNGRLWVGTNAGLNGMDKTTGRCVRYVNDIRTPPGSGLVNNVVNWIHEARDGRLWIGTEGGLSVFDPAGETWRSFTAAEGLPGNVVSGILEDDSGRLWLGTNRGLAVLDPATGASTTYGIHDGLQGPLYNPGACFKAPDGRMYFGGANGYNAFHPANLRKNPFVPPVVWTGLSRGSRDLGLKEPFVSEEGLTVPSKIGFVNLEFAALHFLAPEENRFAYKLEPRDGDWIDLGTEHTVSFAAPVSGRFRLRVKAANPDGVWNEEGLEIPVTVIPPFWRTTWFFGIAAVFFVSGLLTIARMWRKLKSAAAAAGEHLERAVTKYRLTAREEEILRLVLQGAGNRDIEAKLFISSSTVRNHIYNIYQKLGVKNRIELVNLIGKGLT